MKRQNRQTGFSIVEAVIAVVAIAVIGTAGFFVYQHNRLKTTGATGGAQITNNQQTTTTPPAPTVSYLTITEWGVKLPLSAEIKDAYYVPGIGSVGSDGVTNQVYVGLKSQDANGCTAAGSNHGQDSALATIFRSKPGDVDPVTNKLYTQEYPDGVTIGNYFYASEGQASTNISTCKVPQATAQPIESAITAAVKGMISTTAN